MADDNDDLLAQAKASWAQLHQDASAAIGANKVEDEQAAFQSTIDQQKSPKGLLSRAASYAAETGKDLVMHPIDNVEHGWNGVVSGIQDLTVSADQIFSEIPGVNSALDALTGTPGATHEDFAKAVRSGQTISGALKPETNPDNKAGNAIEAVTQFVAGKTAITAATGGGGLLAQGAQSVATMAFAFNPDDPHLSQLLAKVPGLSQPIKDALNNPNHNEWQGRLLGALDGLGFEAGSAAVKGLIGWVKGARGVADVAADTEGSTKIDPTPVTEGTPPETSAEAERPGPNTYRLYHGAAPPGEGVQAFPDAQGQYFTADKQAAEGYAGPNGNVGQFDVEMKNPYHTSENMAYISPEQRAELEAKGHDGVISDHPATGKEYIIFDRSKAKPVPEPEPWTPPTVEGADTANPKGTGGVPEPVEQPKPGEAPTTVQFDPGKFAKVLSGIPKEKAQAVFDAINGGHYDVVAGMLDDTHRTLPWDQLSDGANLKGVLNAVEGEIGDLIKAHHGTGAVTSDAITQMAKDLGGDRTVVSKLYGQMTQDGGLAARITAGYNMLIASSRQLRDLAVQARDMDPKSAKGADALVAFQKQLALHAAITGEVRQASGEIGRALWAHRALKASSDVALTNIGDYANTTLGSKALKQLAAQVANADNLRAFTNISDAASQRGWKQVVSEIAQNGMLSGPKTQITNAFGNLFNMGLKLAERWGAGTMGEIRGVLFPSAQTNSWREAIAYTKGAGEGLKVASKLAWAAMKSENYGSILEDKALSEGATQADKDLAAKAAKFSGPPRQMVKMDTTGRTGLDLTYRQVINSAGTVIRWPGRLMGLFDHFSQGVGYHGDLNAQAYKQAATEADAKGLSGPARDDFLKSRQADLFAKPLTEMDQHAMAAGRYTAFLEPPQTKAGGALYRAINNLDPITKLVVAPFVHRPGNILRQGIGDYTIAGLAQKNIRATLAAGGSDADVAMTRMLLGTSAMLGGLGLAANGSLVGQRLGARNTQSLDGAPQYTIKFGNTWYKYDRLDPVGMWLGLSADMHEAFAHQYDPYDPDSTNALEKAVSASVMALTHSTLDKSFMKSIQEVMEAASERNSDRAVEMAQKLVQDNVAKLVPFSGLSRTLAQVVDPTMRSTGRGSMFDGVVAEIPYLSQELPPRRDLLGREMPVISAWNPFLSTPGNTDPMDQELSKYAMSIQVPSRTIDGYQLNAHEYDEIVRNATQARVFPGGTNIEEYLRNVTGSDAWKNAAAMSDHGQLVNGTTIQKALDVAYTYGKDQFKADHQDLVSKKQTEQLAKFNAAITPQQPNSSPP